MTTSIISVILAGILTDNMVLSKFLGICPFLGVSKKINTAYAFGYCCYLAVIHIYFIAP